jgi:hypothetical protein
MSLQYADLSLTSSFPLFSRLHLLCAVYLLKTPLGIMESWVIGLLSVKSG